MATTTRATCRLPAFLPPTTLQPPTTNNTTTITYIANLPAVLIVFSIVSTYVDIRPKSHYPRYNKHLHHALLLLITIIFFTPSSLTAAPTAAPTGVRPSSVPRYIPGVEINYFSSLPNLDHARVLMNGPYAHGDAMLCIRWSGDAGAVVGRAPEYECHCERGEHEIGRQISKILCIYR